MKPTGARPSPPSAHPIFSKAPKSAERLPEAVADCTLVVGTGSLGHRKPEQPVIPLPELAPLIQKELARGGRIALVFGSEKRGLTQEDLAHCHILAVIPTDPQQPSMNLGQAVAVCLYEIACASGFTRRSESGAPGPSLLGTGETIANTSESLESASARDLDLLAGVVEQTMLAANYSPTAMRKANRHDLHLLLRRLALTRRDAGRILGFFRRILWRLNRLDPLSRLISSRTVQAGYHRRNFTASLQTIPAKVAFKGPMLSSFPLLVHRNFASRASAILVFAAALHFRLSAPSAVSRCSVTSRHSSTPARRARASNPPRKLPPPAESSQPTPAPPPESQPASPLQRPEPSADQPQQTPPRLAAPRPARTSRRNPARARRKPTRICAGTRRLAKTQLHASEPAEITEDEIKTLLVGKELFLRGGYLDNDLSYNENGVLVGHSSQGSYTLSAIQIDKIHLTKHKLELEGQRFGLHFLGALPYEDPTKAVDRVNITPKKKVVKIAIDRELVVKPKEKKEKEKGKEAKSAPNPASAGTPATATAPAPTAPAPPAESTGAPATTEAGQTEIAAAPPAEGPADAKSVTTTTSQAHSNKLLRDALDNVFAQGFDARMMDAMPDFWKLYYSASAAKTDYQPADPNVLRQGMVDKKARLVSTFEPPSNQYAQDHGVAGICLYHVVIGADGKPGEIAVGRPIGFGLDENAVDAIRKATFEPAIKDGKPVPVLLNLVVEFRIYSNRTAVTANPTQQPPESSLPGPYSVQH